MSTDAQTTTPKRGRGRPPKDHDNRRVAAFMSHYPTAFDLGQDRPALDDVLTGATLLQTEGQGSTRPLSRLKLFMVLQHCPTISTGAVSGIFGGECSPATAVRYAAIARVASKAIASHLDRHPAWEEEASTLATSMETIDAPYCLADGGPLAAVAWRQE
jgi:hypothetical protein